MGSGAGRGSPGSTATRVGGEGVDSHPEGCEVNTHNANEWVNRTPKHNKGAAIVDATWGLLIGALANETPVFPRHAPWREGSEHTQERVAWQSYDCMGTGLNHST